MPGALLTLIIPLTPASSRASRHAASCTVSSSSHPPWQPNYPSDTLHAGINSFIQQKERDEAAPFLTFGKTRSCRFGVEIMRTSNSLEKSLLHIFSISIFNL